MRLNKGNGAQPQAPALAFDHVTFAYGETPAVHDVSFDVARGDFVALVGPNGGGKTTLVRLALGLERAQRGSVLLFGKDVREFGEWRRVGYVPQSATAFTVRFPATVSEVVAYGEYRGFDPMAFFRRGTSNGVADALRTVEMWDLRARLISELSVGQRQRVLIARALVRGPDLLFLDEPTSGVDVAGQGQFYALLRQLNHNTGVTIVLVSHDVGVVLHEATKIACINRELQCYCGTNEVTDKDLTRLYGFSADLIIHRHE